MKAATITAASSRLLFAPPSPHQRDQPLLNVIMTYMYLVAHDT